MKNFFKAMIIFGTFLSPLFNAAAATPDLSKFPNANIVLLNGVENITCQKDGSSISIDDNTYLILTRRGCQTMQKLDLHFNSSYEKLQVLTISRISPDGKRIFYDPAKHCAVSIDDSQMSSRIFDPASKICSVSVPDLEVNDKLQIVCRRELFKSRLPGHWSNIAVFQADFPIVSCVLNVDMPAGMPLYHVIKDAVGNTVSSSKKSSSGRTVYSWQVKDVPQIIPEPGMPPLYTCVQRLLVSTVKSWEDISRWYDALCAPKIAAVSDDMLNCVKNLVHGKKSDMEKINALFQYVSQKIRYTGITDETTAPGYEPHEVSRTFERKHGVCRDKAALLVAMLRAANIKAFPVIFMAGAPKDSEIPNIYFNHAIVAVDRGDKDYLLMDPTFETTRELFPAFLGNCSYLVARASGDTLRRSPVIPAKNNLLLLDGKSKLDSSGNFSGELSMEFHGLHDQIYRSAFSSWSKEKIRQYFFAGIRKVIPGAELLSLKISPENVRDMSKKLSLHLTYSANQLLSANLSAQPLPMPVFGRVFGTVNNLFQAFKLEKRRFPLEALPREVAERITLTLPGEFKINALPAKADTHIKDQLRLKRSFTLAGRTLKYENLFAIDTALIPGGKAYDELKKALKHFDANSSALPVVSFDYSRKIDHFREGDFQNADAVVSSDIRTIEKRNGKIIEKRKIIRKILTYAGAVTYSTLQIPYIEGVSSARVSGYSISPDGSRHQLEPGEINLLDAPWTKDVSRYPKGKVITAAFPGIIPGSTVCFEYEKTVPADNGIYFACMKTSGAEPVILRKLTIKGKDFKTSPAALGYTVTEKNNCISAECRNVPRQAAENAQASRLLFTPVFMLSDTDLPTFAARLDAALKKHLQKKSPAVKLWAQEIRRAASRRKTFSVSPVIDELHDTVTKKLRSGGPELYTLPWSSFSSPETTIAEACGNSADRAIVCAALLDELGIKYQFTASSGEAASEAEMRLLKKYPRNIFSDILLYLPEYNIYLNAAGNYAHAGTNRFENMLSLELPSGKLFAMPAKGKTASLTKVRCRIDISAGGDAVLYIDSEYKGVPYEKSNANFSRLPGVMKKQYFEELGAKISQSASVMEYRTSFDGVPGKTGCKIYIPGFVTKFGSYLSFRLPLFELFQNEVKVFSTQRLTPMMRKNNFNQVLEYEINLPPDAAVIPMRQQKLALGIPGKMLYSEKYSTSGRKLKLTCKMQIKAGLFSPQEYGSLLDLNKFLNQADNARILMKQGSK